MAGVSGNHQATPINNAAASRSNSGINQENVAWEKTLNMLQERIDKKEEQILKTEAAVFQVANYYFVFQGVVINAVITLSTSSFCRYFWLPLLLTIIGGILNVSTLYVTAKNYKKSLNDLDNRKLVWYRHSTRNQRATLNRNQERREIKMWMSMALISTFAILSIVASVVIPCNY